jgi:hypothetical protein
MLRINKQLFIRKVVIGKMELNERQKRFSDFHLDLGNATEMAIKERYSKKYAGTNVDKLLKNTKIKVYIEERLKKIGSRRVTTAEVQTYLILFSKTMTFDSAIACAMPCFCTLGIYV